MYSIGDLSREAGVKVPTIRYYEDRGLLKAAGRTAGNQRRYDTAGLDRLRFIKHARDLGFSTQAICALIDLQTHPDRSCHTAGEIAAAQLKDVRDRIRRLQALEAELVRITEGCAGDGPTEECYVLASLADHTLCRHEH